MHFHIWLITISSALMLSVMWWMRKSLVLFIKWVWLALSLSLKHRVQSPPRGECTLLQWLCFKINKTIHTRTLLSLAMRADHYYHDLKQVSCLIKEGLASGYHLVHVNTYKIIWCTWWDLICSMGQGKHNASIQNIPLDACPVSSYKSQSILETLLKSHKAVQVQTPKEFTGINTKCHLLLLLSVKE